MHSRRTLTNGWHWWDSLQPLTVESELQLSVSICRAARVLLHDDYLNHLFPAFEMKAIMGSTTCVREAHKWYKHWMFGSLPNLTSIYDRWCEKSKLAVRENPSLLKRKSC